MIDQKCEERNEMYFRSLKVLFVSHTELVSGATIKKVMISVLYIEETGFELILCAY